MSTVGQQATLVDKEAVTLNLLPIDKLIEDRLKEQFARNFMDRANYLHHNMTTKP